MLRRVRKLIPDKFIKYTRHLLTAFIANVRYGFPSRRLNVIGVTGTDGKTTTVNMIYKVLKDSGKKVSMISTINAVIAGKNYDTGFHVTSPSPFMIQKFIKQSANNKDEYLILEVTSHALEQFRVFGVNFKVGVITNITHDHLDYHKNYENYLNAKAKLVRGAKYAVLNFDDSSFNKLSKVTKGKIVSYGLSKKSDVSFNKFPIRLQIPGSFNIYNGLAALAVANVLGIDIKKAIRSLAGFKPLPGRMEQIKNNKNIKVIVDFAHTPNGLEQALKTLKSLSSGRVIAVFGAAAERDIQKRPKMGLVSAKLSDITILTDEDPRYEDSLSIIDNIAQAMHKAGAALNKTLFIEPDRQKAIDLAVTLAKRGDIIGVFGKGHEKSMSYRGKEVPWSDQEAVRKSLSNAKPL